MDVGEALAAWLARNMESVVLPGYAGMDPGTQPMGCLVVAAPDSARGALLDDPSIGALPVADAAGPERAVIALAPRVLRTLAWAPDAARRFVELPVERPRVVYLGAGDAVAVELLDVPVPEVEPPPPDAAPTTAPAPRPTAWPAVGGGETPERDARAWVARNRAFVGTIDAALAASGGAATDRVLIVIDGGRHAAAARTGGQFEPRDDGSLAWLGQRFFARQVLLHAGEIPAAVFVERHTLEGDLPFVYLSAAAPTYAGPLTRADRAAGTEN
jgi:hypothetical protein